MTFAIERIPAFRRIRTHPFNALAIAVALGGCSGRIEPALTEVVDSAGVRIVAQVINEPARSCSLSASPRFSAGEGNAMRSELIGVTDALQLDDRRVAIAARGTAEVRLYDSSGKFLGAFGRQGDGPGEFHNVSRIWPLSRDTIAVADYRPWRLQVFTTDGQFHRAIVPEPRDVRTPRVAEVLRQGLLIRGYPCCLLREPGFHEQHLPLTRHDATGAFIDTLGQFPFGEWGQLETGVQQNSWVLPLFESLTSVTAFDRTIVVGVQSRDELLYFGHDGRLRQIVRWRLPGGASARAVEERDIDAYRRSRIAAVRPGNQWAIEEDISPARPVRRQFPAFTGLWASEDGAVWVQLYRRPARPDSVRYLHFDAGGRFSCVLELSTARTLLRAADGHIILHETSEEGTERVTIYDVAK